jgi:hypothetical protein
VSCPELSASARAALDLHGAEVLRWNVRFSLISRNAPEQRLLALQQECEAAFRALHEAWPRLFPGSADSVSALRYIDLGSGGGFPGLIWHAWLQDVGLPGMTHVGTLLVEPRDKRAWLLDQVARTAGWQLEVRRTTWGPRQPVVPPPAIPAHDLITLKALRLTDEEILAGCRRGRPAAGTPLTICRFCSNEEESATRAESDLGLPPSGPSGSPAEPFSFRLPFTHPSGPDTLLISHYPKGA